MVEMHKSFCKRSENADVDSGEEGRRGGRQDIHSGMSGVTIGAGEQSARRRVRANC